MLTNPVDRSLKIRNGLPVVPGAFPLLGHLPALYFDALHFFRNSRDRFGPLFWMRIGENWILTSAAREGFDILRSKSVSMEHLKTTVGVLAGDALIAKDGAAHRRVRPALSQPFMPRNLATTKFGSVTAELFSERVASWLKRRSVVVLKEMQDVALQVIFRLIGVEASDFRIWGERYRDFVWGTLPVLPKWLPGSPLRRAARGRQWLDARILEIVRAGRARPSTGSFISELVHSKDEQGQMLSEEELVDNLRFFCLPAMTRRQARWPG